MAVIVVSSELEELFHISDEIAVLRKGHVRRVLRREEFSKERVLLAASGLKETP
jgi:ABC-type sugar transport system ATPase subunit